MSSIMRLALAYIIISDSWVASCGLSGVSISSSGERMSVSGVRSSCAKFVKSSMRAL